MPNSRKPTTWRATPEELNRLSELSKELGLSQSGVLRLALSDLHAKHKSRLPRPPKPARQSAYPEPAPLTPAEQAEWDETLAKFRAHPTDHPELTD